MGLYSTKRGTNIKERAKVNSNLNSWKRKSVWNSWVIVDSNVSHPSNSKCNSKMYMMRSSEYPKQYEIRQKRSSLV